MTQHYAVLLFLDGAISWLVADVPQNEAREAAKAWTENNPGQGFATLIPVGEFFGTIS